MAEQFKRIPWDILGLTTACIVLGAVLGAAVDGALFTSGSVANYIKGWQTLIGFLGTIGVGIIAWVNVSRQLDAQRRNTRLSILTREEDRIERLLPGLQDASMMLSLIARTLNKNGPDPVKCRDTLSRYGFTAFDEKTSGEEISKALPFADPSIQQTVRRQVRRILAAIILIERAQKSGDQEKLREWTGALTEAIEHFSNFHQYTRNRFEAQKAMAKNMRTEIEGLIAS